MGVGGSSFAERRPRVLREDITPGQPEMFQGGITDGDNAGPDGNAFN